MTEELNRDEIHAAYVCGRLLAMFDGLQYAVSPNLNQRVADRYYSLASTNPQLAFPKLVDLGLKHTRKLRQDKPGLAINIERDIQGLLQTIGVVFPPPLGLEDQGRFALGFHHQRAAILGKKQQKEGESA